VDRLSLLDETLRAFDSSLPRVVSPRCVVTRYRASTCRSCVDVCPADALALAPLAVDADRCIACGACATVCRTGALDYPRSRSLVHGRLAERSGDKAIIACSQADLADAGMIANATIACLAGLSSADLITAAAAGRDGLVLVSGDCPGCPAGSAMAGAGPEDSPTAAWLSRIGVSLSLHRVTTTSNGEPVHPAAAPVSRRDLFGLLAGRGREVAAAVLASSAPRIEDLHAVTPPPAAHLRMLVDLENLASRVVVWRDVLPDDLPCASVEFADGCDGCGLCVRYCPHGALMLSEGLVAVDPRSCTGCGLCAEMCPREAVRLGPGSMPGLVTDTPVRESSSSQG